LSTYEFYSGHGKDTKMDAHPPKYTTGMKTNTAQYFHFSSRFSKKRKGIIFPVLIVMNKTYELDRCDLQNLILALLNSCNTVIMSSSLLTPKYVQP